MSPRHVLFAVALVLPLAACAPKPAATTAGAPAPAPAQPCDRQCLYGVLDAYLAALKARDASAVKWTKDARYTENNVELSPGDALWGTITGLDPYEMRFADTKEGQVAIFGVVEETNSKSPYATRLKVVNGAVAEAETLVIRKDEAGIPFVTADIKALPVWSEVIPEAERDPREVLVKAADGYFNTLQLNDGTLHVQFTDDCNRREDGMQSTNLTDPGLDPIWRMGCADQFRQGAYRYDDRVRARRYMVVDEELGIVLSAGFIDHEGRLVKFKLANGQERESIFKRPNTLAFLEAFKVKKGAIRQVESVFHTVPYRMPSPWGP
jgi:hypothetical protein